MGVYRQLITVDIPTRTAARLSGVARATATRKTSRTAVPAAVVVPANRLSVRERARILLVVNSPRFVDLAPIQIYATLLGEGV